MRERDLMEERCPACTQKTLVYVGRDRAECRHCGCVIYQSSGHDESKLREWESHERSRRLK